MKFLVSLAIVLGMGLFGCEEDKGNDPIVIEGLPPPLPPGTPVPTIPPPPRLPDRVTFDRFEADALEYVTSVAENDREFTRMFSLCNRYNQKQMSDRLVRAIDKVINSLSRERVLTKTVSADPQGCIRAINLRDFGLSREDWRRIELMDEWQLTSETARGVLLQTLTQARRPWISADTFVQTAMANRVIRTQEDLNLMRRIGASVVEVNGVVSASIYYRLLGLADNIQEVLLRNLGVNLQQEFDNLDIILAGNFESLIAQQKNRLVSFGDSPDGTLMSTWDVDINNQGGRGNLLSNPFPIEARSNLVFDHNAQEHIASLPNGLHLYILNGAAGGLELVAPENIVINTKAMSVGLPASIDVGHECMECHSKGPIPFRDRIRENCEGNQNIPAQDRQLCQAFYKRPEAQIAKLRDVENQYTFALQQLGITSYDVDPVNEYLVNPYRQEWDLNKLASFFFLTEDEMRECINSSATARTEVSVLLNGGRVSIEQLKLIKDDLIFDCNLLKDDLGE